MGDLFDDFPEFPRMPQRVYTFKIRGGKFVVASCVTVTMYGLCPKNEHPHLHPTHADHTPMSARVLASAVIGSTSTT
jgi:hypothetical protein